MEHCSLSFTPHISATVTVAGVLLSLVNKSHKQHYVAINVVSETDCCTVMAYWLNGGKYPWILNLHSSVAYPGIFFGVGVVQQIQLRTERTGIWGR